MRSGRERGGSIYRQLQGRLMEALEPRILLTGAGPTPPVVSALFVDSTSWSPAFLNVLASTGHGNATLGYLVPTGQAQLRPLPWVNINQISIVFSDNVNVTQDMLTVTGLNVPSYAIANFSYNNDVATWTLNQNLPNDLIQLNLSDEVANLAGTPLDGEWVDGLSTVSGNGVPGGDFVEHLNVLPGNSTGSGMVDINDLAVFAANWQATVTNWTQAQSDFDGSGTVDINDLSIVAADWQTSLPGLKVISLVANTPTDLFTNAPTVSYTVTFSNSVTGVDASDFQIASTGVGNPSIASVTGSAEVYTITVNTGTGSGTLGLNLVDNDSIVDPEGDPLGGFGVGNGNKAGPVYTIDHTPPRVSSITTTTNSPTNLTTLTFNVAFSEAVTGVDAGDFNAATVNLSGSPVIDSVTGSGANYTVTVTTGPGQGTVTLNLVDDNSILDVAANPLGGPALGDGNASSPPVSIDTIVPKITAVYVFSSEWSASFLNYLAANSLGSATYGYLASTGGTQLQDLPWTNLNQVSIQFSKDVDVTRNSLTIGGSNTVLYNVTAFTYNSTTHVATWSLAAPIANDKLILTVSTGAIRDDAGNTLDGEWTTGVSTVSGDGTAGGDFDFRFNVLPGDVQDSGTVTPADLSAVENLAPADTTSPSYSIFADVDGDGQIGSADINAVDSLESISLPANDPGLPANELQSYALMNEQATWTSSNPGGFGTITAGVATRMIIGVSTTADSRGWAATISDPFNSYFQTDQSVNDDLSGGYLYGWFNFASFDNANGGAGDVSSIAQFLSTPTDNPRSGQLGANLVIRADGSLGLSTNEGITYDATPLSLNTWYRIAVQWTGDAWYSFQLLVGTATGPMTQVDGATSASMENINDVGVTNTGYIGAATGVTFRLSAYYLYTMAEGATVSDPPGLIAPPTGPFSFYIRSDAVGGGDGSADTPQDALTWAEACLYAPVVSIAPTHNFVFANGDGFVDPTLYSAAELRDMYLDGQVIYAGDHWILGTNIVGAASGLVVDGEFTSAGNNDFTVSGLTTLSGAVQYDPVHYPDVWVMPSTSQTVLFEDGKWMHLVEGTTIDGTGTESGTGYSSVAAALEAVPGSFFNDGVNFYFSTFDGAAPSTHTYTRTNNFLAPGIIALVAVDGYLHNVNIEGTTLANPDGTAVGSYCFLASDSDWSVVDDVTTAYSGYHAGGSLDGGSNGRLTVMNITLGPSAPSENDDGNPYWFAWGGQIPWVSYNATIGATGNQTDLYNVSIPYTDGLVGTTTGFANNDTPAIYSHNAGIGQQYSNFNVTDSVVGGGIGLVDNIAFVTLQNVTATSITVWTGTGDGLVTTVGGISGDGGDFQVTHSLVQGTAGLALNFQGGVSFNYCTFDMSNFNDDTSNNLPLFGNSGDGTTSIHNCIIIGVQSTFQLLTVYRSFSGSTLSADYNLYVPSPGSIFSYQYNIGGVLTNIATFADWQATGQDTHSQVLTSIAALGLNANYIPQAGSPALGASSDGIAIGAYQPAP